MRLYRKENGLCDYWEVQINFPWIGKRKHYVDIVGVVEGTEYGLSFPTKCCLHKEDEFFWFFTLRILGFGTTIVRQNGY